MTPETALIALIGLVAAGAIMATLRETARDGHRARPIDPARLGARTREDGIIR